MTCKCYHAERNFLGKIGVCWGTKECEACSCGGDESKCDFYEYKRIEATQKTTNGDTIRAMSDKDLAMILQSGCPTRACKDRTPHDCYNCWLEWLKEEKDD